MDDSRTTVANLDFTDVPTWSDADIMAQFAAIRDNAYLTDSANSQSPLRRLSWMFPHDGCWARADQFNTLAAEAGKTRPYTLFAFGGHQGLRAYTDNHQDGFVIWTWHIVPVVKNSQGEPIVFDAALNPCRPLPYKEWLGLMADSLDFYDNLAAGRGVVIADSWAISPESLVSGHVNDEYDIVWLLENELLPAEWLVQASLLGYPPTDVLGPNPPWGGYNCVATHTESTLASMASLATATVTANCPFGTIAVGGGYELGAPTFQISSSLRSGNSWAVMAKNTHANSKNFTATATCLTGAPASASISTVEGNAVSLNANSDGTSTALCDTGTLVSGGFSTAVSGFPASTPRIYASKRMLSLSSTWQVSAYNTSSSTSKSVTAFGYCLHDSGFTFNQAAGTDLSAEGVSSALCGSNDAMGIGFTFPMTTAYTVSSISASGGSADMRLLPAPGGTGDAGARAFAQCLTHP